MMGLATCHNPPKCQSQALGFITCMLSSFTVSHSFLLGYDEQYHRVGWPPSAAPSVLYPACGGAEVADEVMFVSVVVKSPRQTCLAQSQTRASPRPDAHRVEAKGGVNLGCKISPIGRGSGVLQSGDHQTPCCPFDDIMTPGH
ncbi:Hypothetical predicted protein [Scomber scombrus]|uniref:Uncharacterized protein n=1 Tax=Scomber scombrus TaxID=13677 RepID=A0AAV1NMB7_SCOSC